MVERSTSERMREPGEAAGPDRRVVAEVRPGRGVELARLEREELRRRLRELVAAYADAYRGLERYAYTGRRRIALYVRWLWRGDPAGFIVAVDSGRAVGFAACHGQWEMRDGRPLAELHELVVARSAQRRGVGSALLAAAIDHARAVGAAELGLAVGEGNERARDLYLRHGFEPVGASGAWLRMRLKLTPRGAVGRAGAR